MAQSNYDEGHDYFSSPYLAGGSNPHFYEPSSVGLDPMAPQIERIAQSKVAPPPADATGRRVRIPEEGTNPRDAFADAKPINPDAAEYAGAVVGAIVPPGKIGKAYKRTTVPKAELASPLYREAMRRDMRQTDESVLRDRIEDLTENEISTVTPRLP